MALGRIEARPDPDLVGDRTVRIVFGAAAEGSSNPAAHNPSRASPFLRYSPPHQITWTLASFLTPVPPHASCVCAPQCNPPTPSPGRALLSSLAETGYSKAPLSAPPTLLSPGVHELEKAGVRAAFMSAVCAATDRANQLSKM